MNVFIIPVGPIFEFGPGVTDTCIDIKHLDMENVCVTHALPG